MFRRRWRKPNAQADNNNFLIIWLKIKSSLDEFKGNPASFLLAASHHQRIATVFLITTYTVVFGEVKGFVNGPNDTFGDSSTLFNDWHRPSWWGGSWKKWQLPGWFVDQITCQVEFCFLFGRRFPSAFLFLLCFFSWLVRWPRTYQGIQRCGIQINFSSSNY